MSKKSFVQVLGENGKITIAQARDAMQRKQTSAKSLEDILQDVGVAEADIIEAKAQVIGVPLLDVEQAKDAISAAQMRQAHPSSSAQSPITSSAASNSIRWPKWAKYLVWGVGIWLFCVLVIWNDSKVPFPDKLVGPLFFIAFWEAVVWACATAYKNRKPAQPKVKPPTLKQQVDTALAQLNQFVVSQQHFLAKSKAASGIAVDSISNKICLFDYNTSTGIANTRVFTVRDILTVEVIEDVDSEIEEFTTSKTKTSGKSMIGRAIVGGVLLGPAGAVLGGATAKKHTKATTRQIVNEVVNSVDLKLVVNDSHKPIRTVHFLDYPAIKGDDKHKAAITKAAHWHALITVLKQRG